MTPDPKVDLTGAAEVTLAGQVFKVPTPPLRYAMRLIDLGNEIGTWTDRNWTEKEYTTAAEAVWQALRLPYPDLTLDGLLDMPILLDEIAAAVPVILAQTRAFRVLKPGEKPGEAQATAQ